jgi:isochorismate hydrolase
VWADSAYRGKDLAEWCEKRTFGWLSRNRRTARDYERKVQTNETLIEIAMTRLLLARLGRGHLHDNSSIPGCGDRCAIVNRESWVTAVGRHHDEGIMMLPGGRSRSDRLKGAREAEVPHEEGENMTTLKNRPNTALLVIDVQKGVVAGNHERDTVVANVGSLVEKARQERVPVVWVQHSDEQLVRGSDDWQIVSELMPGEAEPLVEKNYGDAFEDTSLESVLSGLAVGRLVVVGAQTDACIRSTLHGAFARGYDATLVSDAHTTEDQTAWGAPPPEQVIAHTNLYWTYQTAPGRTAGTVETKHVDFGATS